MFEKNFSAAKFSAAFAWLILFAAFAIINPVYALDDNSNGANRPPRPMDASETVLSALERYRIVALGEAHSLQTEHYFIQDLIRNPQFPAKTRDIVIEFANARYQNTIDRYLNGENVSFAELSQVWRDTVVSPAEQWDAPVYENFFRTVRQVNATLPANRKLRVWAAEPPIDWNTITTREQVFAWRLQREPHIASIVKNNVLAQGRNALMIYGSTHLTKKSAAVPGLPEPPKNALQLILETYPNSAFVIIPHLGFNENNVELEKKLRDWNKPSIALVEKTWLGRLSPRVILKDLLVGGPGGAPFDPWEGLKFQDIADAYLFMGTHDELTKVVPSPFIYRDDAYFNELNRRFTIMRGAPIDEKTPEYYVYGIPKLQLPPPPAPQ